MPVEYPSNPWTQLIERVHQGNIIGGHEGSVSAEPSPSVRSAAMGPVPEAAPLSDAERAELDAKAMALGIVPLEQGAPSAGAYGSLEEAMAAGAPVERHAAEVPLADRQTAREFLAGGAMRGTSREMFSAAPRLPDFKKVQMIDLVRGVVFVDSMEFPMAPEDVEAYRRWCVEVVRAAIVSQLNSALEEFNSPTGSAEGKDGPAGGPAGSEEVQQVSPSLSAEGLREVQDVPGVPGARQDVRQQPAPAGAHEDSAGEDVVSQDEGSPPLVDQGGGRGAEE